MDEYILELRNITKRFPGVVALNGVQFQLKQGEIHALMGENGAGKSTLIKVITGVHEPEEGDMAGRRYLKIPMIRQPTVSRPFISTARSIRI